MRRKLYDENKKAVPNSFELSPDSIVTVKAFTLNRDDVGLIENRLTFLTGKEAYRYLPKDIVKIIEDKNYYVVAFEVKEVASWSIYVSSVEIRIYKEKPDGFFKIIDTGYCRYATMHYSRSKQPCAAVVIDEDFVLIPDGANFLPSLWGEARRLKKHADEVRVHLVLDFNHKDVDEGRKRQARTFLCKLFETNTLENNTRVTYPYRGTMNRLKQVLLES